MVSDVRRSFWLSLADSYLAIVLQMASTMIIARILTPKEVGIFAIAAVISTLANMFRDFGFAEYLIQARNLDNDKIRAALGMNIVMSWTMAALVYALAPWAADFYHEPGVGDVLHVLALSFLIVPFGAVVQSWFRRELNYRPIVIANALSNVAAFVVGIVLALAGYRYMALAWSSFAGIVVTVIASLWFRPRGFPRWPGVKGIAEVFHFGKYASGIYILAQLGRGAPELIIGRVDGAADVGMFSRANSVVELLRRLLERPVMQVCLPYFAKEGREGGSIVPAYASSVGLITGAAWPTLACLAAMAYAVIRIVYGDQWTAAVPLAQVLCLMCAIDMVTMLAREALLACGEARRAGLLQLGVTLLQFAGLMLVFPYGLPGAAWGLVLAALGALLFAHWHLRATIGLDAMTMVRACAKSAALTLWTAGPVWAACAFIPLDEDNFVRWGLAGGIGAALLWISGLKLLDHPLWHEFEQVRRRLLGRSEPAPN